MNEEELDNRIRSLVASAVADVSAPRPFSALNAQPASGDQAVVVPFPRRRGRMIVWTAVGVAASLVVGFVLIRSAGDDHQRVTAATSSSVESTTMPGAPVAWPAEITAIVASDRGIETVTAENGEAVVTRLTDADGPGGTLTRAYMQADGEVVASYCCQEVALPHILATAEDGSTRPVDEFGGVLMDVAADGAVLYVEGNRLMMWVDGVRTQLSTAPDSAGLRPEFHFQSDSVYGTWDRSLPELAMVIVHRSGQPVDAGAALGSVATATGVGLQEARLEANGQLWVTDSGGTAQEIIDFDPAGVIGLDVSWPYVLVSYEAAPPVLVDASTRSTLSLPMANGFATFSLRPTNTTTPSTTTLVVTPTPVDVSSTVVTAGPDGVWRVVDGVAEQLTTDAMSMALQLPDGSVVMQRSSGWTFDGDQSDTTLLVWHFGQLNELFPGETLDGWVRLYDVAMVNGEMTVLYAVEQEAQPQSALVESVLVTRSLETFETIVVDAEFGGWEQGYSRMHLAENGLIVGEYYQEVRRELVSYSMFGRETFTAAMFGLESAYTDCSDCPRLYTLSRDGATLAWLDGTSLVRVSLAAAAGILYAPIDLGGLGPSAREATNLELGNGFVVLSSGWGDPAPVVIEFGTLGRVELPGTAASIVTVPTAPWQLHDELTTALQNQTFDSQEELYAAVEAQIEAILYAAVDPVEPITFTRSVLPDFSLAIAAPNFDDSVPQTWFRIVLGIGMALVIDRIESVDVCRNGTYSTPTHLCV